jgi:thiamine-monophosphate kinase
MGESEEVLIRRLREVFNTTFQSGVEVGIGDDAAIFSATGSRLVATVDTAVEGIHFRRNWSSSFQIGAKLTTASLADVFAMGGEPKYLLVAAAIPESDNKEVIEELAKGIRSVADRFQVSVIGGDLSKSEKLLLSITALGEIDRTPLTRSGAKVGQIVYVSTLPGLSAAGLATLSRNLDRPKFVIDAHLNPKLTKPERLISVATAMSDISDGLSIDALHIAQESKVSIHFSKDLISKADDFRYLSEIADEFNEDVFSWILNGGEDHFFIATVDSSITDYALGVPIGRVEVGDGRVFLDGVEIEKGGYQHF